MLLHVCFVRSAEFYNVVTILQRHRAVQHPSATISVFMTRRIAPATRLQGSVLLPGDKSVSHRYAMLAGIADGSSTLHNYSTGADCQSTLNCMRGLGVEWSRSANVVQVEGRGPDGLKAPSA